MALIYTRTVVQSSGSFLTDLKSTSGKSWPSEGTGGWIEQGITSSGRTPVFINFRGDLFCVGAFSRVVYRPKTERRFIPAGIKGPRIKIAVVEGGGAGGSVGRALAYVTLLHKVGDLELAESDRSNVVDIGTVAGGGFVWSNLPTIDEDLRVTTIRGYRSMDGDDYRMAFEQPFGISGFTENVLTPDRTLTAPKRNDNDIPPVGLHFATDFGGRMFYAHTAEHPYRLWWSAAGNPQYVNPLKTLDTWDRAAITCVAKARNALIVFTRFGAYLVRQFGRESLEDFILQKLDTGVGCINHHGAIEIHNRLWFPSEDGIWIYDSGFLYLMRDMRPYWVADYDANKGAFQSGFAYDDKSAKTYVFQTGRSPTTLLDGEFVCGTIAYVGTYENYEPSIAGPNRRPSPDWTVDIYGRRNSSALFNRDREVLIGSCDGLIRKHDDTDPDDDGDTLVKELVIRHGANNFMQPGDDIESGKTINDFWCYVEAELNAWTLRLLGGDEHAWRQIVPENTWQFWKVDVPASLSTYSKTIGAVTKLLQASPKTVHYFGKPPKVSGRCLAVEVRVKSPVGVVYRGHGGSFEPGPAYRPPELETNFALTTEWRVQGDPTFLTGNISVTGRGANVTIEIKTTATYPFGAPGYPIALTLDFEGTNMPADDTDSIVSPNFDVTTLAVFSVGGAMPATGTLDITGTDGNGIVGKAAPQLTVSVVE